MPEVSKNIVESINKEILSLEIALSLTKMSKKVALNASRIAALCTDPIELRYLGVAPAKAISSPIASWNPLFAPSLKN